jgi:zinc protease
MIVTTLARGPLPPAIGRLPRLADVGAMVAFRDLDAAPRAPAPDVAAPHLNGTRFELLLQRSPLPQVEFKLLFAVGSASDPPGKEGLAALTASMIAKAGSRALTIDQIDEALYPIAGSFTASTDREMTTFTGSIHRDEWRTFLATVLPQLVDPGFREADFSRLKSVQLNALVQDLRSGNDEELAKERLQAVVFRGTPYGHVPLGTIAGLDAIALDDVRRFAAEKYVGSNLSVGVSGDAPALMLEGLQGHLARLTPGRAEPKASVEARRPSGIDVEIIEKDTRATAISLGFPIGVTRSDPDFAALSVARAWLGEHRIGSGRLFQRMREVRGLNYGDYAYIEAFPRGMFQFFPDPNLARQRQLFEIWIRPVVPVNANMALRIALFELDELVRKGLTSEEFERTREYLMNNVYVMTARQDQQLGYALDSRWYGMGEFTDAMRRALADLTVDRVNAAIRRHLAASDLFVVMVTKDAAGLERELVSDEGRPIRYDGAKPESLLAEDRLIAARPLNIRADSVRVTPVGDVFAR